MSFKLRFGRRPSFSLLELVAVSALVVLALGIVSFNMKDLTDRGRLSAAMDQLSSIYNVARLRAMRTGRPLMLRCDGRRLVVRAPVKAADVWNWEDMTAVDFVRKITIRRVTSGPATGQLESDHSMWEVMVHPNGTDTEFRFLVDVAGGPEAVIALDGISGEARLIESAENRG